ncbi:MAG: hypothetical protein M4579_003378 [Chaenotheca gracillima]|nr:MAG: hypothetical protein M4579_003378 [Chaenotheca gracillima]
MAAYETDSSDDDGNYTETSVLLGYASKEPTDDVISQLGGSPTWLDAAAAPSAALARCKICNSHMALLLQLNGDLPEQFPGHERRIYIFSCRRKTCRRKQGCIRAIRGVRATKTEPTSQPKAPSTKDEGSEKQDAPARFGETLFGTKATLSTQSSNPFSTAGSGSGGGSVNPFTSARTSNPFSSTSASQSPSSPANNTPPSQNLASQPDTPSVAQTFASKLSLSETPNQAPHLPPTPPEPWPSPSDLPPTYPQYNLDADYETLSPETQPPSNSSTTTNRPAISTDDEPTSSAAEAETYESPLDKPFLRFADRLAQNPLQVLRYEFRGSPLLYSHSDAVGKALAAYQPHHQQPERSMSTSRVSTTGKAGAGTGMPSCPNCGAGRVFELQLTPHAIAELEADEMSLDGMDWGTAILGVCGKDCVPSRQSTTDGKVMEVPPGYLEEWVGVQWEELGGKRT